MRHNRAPWSRALREVRQVAAVAARANRPRRLRRRAARPNKSAGSTSAVTRAELDEHVELPPLDLSIPPWPGQYVQAAGVQLFVRCTPCTGPVTAGGTAVYVHGLGGASTNWTDLAGQLAPWVVGYAVDLPGFGQSGPSPTGGYSIPDHTRVVIAFIERLVAAGSGPVQLFGNSMGGAIAIAVAARRPELVRTLTLISPAVPDLRIWRDDDPRAVLLLLPGVGTVAMRRLASLSPDARARGVIWLCFGDASRVPEHRIAEAADEIRHRSGMQWADAAFRASMRGLVRTWFTARPWHDLADISAPTLVVWGERDRLVSPALANVVAAAIPRSRLLTLPDVGHVAQLEEPVTVARAILGLWEATGVVAGQAGSAVRS